MDLELEIATANTRESEAVLTLTVTRVPIHRRRRTFRTVEATPCADSPCRCRYRPPFCPPANVRKPIGCRSRHPLWRCRSRRHLGEVKIERCSARASCSPNARDRPSESARATPDSKRRKTAAVAGSGPGGDHTNSHNKMLNSTNSNNYKMLKPASPSAAARNASA